MPSNFNTAAIRIHSHYFNFDYTVIEYSINDSLHKWFPVGSLTGLCNNELAVKAEFVTILAG